MTIDVDGIKAALPTLATKEELAEVKQMTTVKNLVPYLTNTSKMLTGSIQNWQNVRCLRVTTVLPAGKNKRRSHCLIRIRQWPN